MLADKHVRWNGLTAVGPDGFPYMIAFAKRNKYVLETKPERIRDIAYGALKASSGLAIYESSLSEYNPTYRFSLGALSMLVKGLRLPTRAPDPPVRQNDDTVLVGAPDIDALPELLRVAISAHFRSKYQIAAPKVALVGLRSRAGDIRQPYCMCVNVPRHQFSSRDCWRSAAGELEWFIPPIFSTVQPPEVEQDFAAWFRDLPSLEPIADRSAKRS